MHEIYSSKGGIKKAVTSLIIKDKGIYRRKVEANTIKYEESG